MKNRPTPADNEALRSRLAGVDAQRVVRLAGVAYSTVVDFRDGETERLQASTFAKIKQAMRRIAIEDAPLHGFRTAEVRLRVIGPVEKTPDGFIHFQAEVSLPALEPVKEARARG